MVDEAIILEDDCLPDATFFRFCQELLQYYKDDERVMMICGTNMLGEWRADRPESYFFTHYDWVWGWASWRRAWKHNDPHITMWGDHQVRDRIKSTLMHEKYYRLRAMTFEQVYKNKVVTWDFQWACSRLIQGGLAIAPRVNLISNLGYGRDATHTKVLDEDLAAIAARTVTFPLVHNSSFVPEMEYDLKVVEMLTIRNSLVNRIVRLFRLIRLCLSAR
jgi:hypothetical protein